MENENNTQEETPKSAKPSKKAAPEPKKTHVGFHLATLDVTLRNRPGAILCVHKFSEKAKAEIRDKQAHKARDKKGVRNIEEEWTAARHIDDQGRECVPITALKKAMVTAATAFDDITKVALRQAIFVMPADDRGSHLVPIETHEGKPAVGVCQEDAVTIGINVRGLAYRPVYTEWQLRVRFEYQPRLVSEEQLLALIDQAGWGVGIMEGRPEKSSALGWGRFERVVK